MGTARDILLRLAAAAALWMLTATPTLAQVVTENAGATSPEIVLVRQSVLHQNYENGSDLRWIQGVQWSLDPKREFRLSLPVIAKTVKFADSSTSMFGPGDVTFRYKQSLWQSDGVMSSERWAFLSELGLHRGDGRTRSHRRATPATPAVGLGVLQFGSRYSLYLHSRPTSLLGRGFLSALPSGLGNASGTYRRAERRLLVPPLSRGITGR